MVEQTGEGARVRFGGNAAGLLCRPYELGMRVERTEESWCTRELPSAGER
jgi:hypothetical protein